ncbi:MAG: zf-HC2 domain-containing protein, partial [Acidobacteriia bacterium]|nr:zf-HC2 domain-containing protein [Terriglobia bacterium]
MNCAETEILICEYVEGGLAADLKSELERHFAACPACAELARDSAAGFAFMERAAEVDRKYFASSNVTGSAYSGYYVHNLHFILYSRLMQGRRAEALRA